MSVIRPNDLPDDQKPLLYIFWASGVLFIGLGIAGFTFPHLLDEWIGLDGMVANIICGQFIFMGFIELFVLPKIIIKNKQRQEQDNNND